MCLPHESQERCENAVEAVAFETNGSFKATGLLLHVRVDGDVYMMTIRRGVLLSLINQSGESVTRSEFYYSNHTKVHLQKYPLKPGTFLGQNK